MRRDLSKPKVPRGESSSLPSATDPLQGWLSPGSRPAARPQMWAAVPLGTCLGGGR
jgi:hypothetical protein